MCTNESQTYKKVAKWIILTVSACILVYLSVRYINVIAKSIWWLIGLVLPILMGIIIALVLNIPLHFFEDKLFTKIIPTKSQKKKRNLSILCSLVSILGVIILVLFLVVPELIQAIITLINIGTDSIRQLSLLEESIDFSSVPFGDFLQKIQVDWSDLASRLQDFLPTFMENLAVKIPVLLSSSIGIIVDVILGIIFAIYILGQKEKLKHQVNRLLRAWLPENPRNILIHVTEVCVQSFRSFIVGQTTEAIILGTLCCVGMAILRLPYAPTIGVLVGVTAFIPYIGAYIGAIVGAVMILTISPFKTLVFLVFLVLLQQVEGNVIYPKVVGSRINLPSLWVLAALTVGGNLAGPFGMILAVPAFSAGYNLLSEATAKKEKNI